MLKKNHIYFIFSICLLFTILCSCGEKPLYMKTHKFKDNRWEQNEKLVFNVDFPGDTLTYDVLFNLRSTVDYSYNNIWLYITTTGPECKDKPGLGSIMGRVPVEIKMTKPNGEWIGDKSGTYVDHKLKFRQRRFCKGQYRFEIEQGVTIGTLEELSDLTIEVKPTIW